MTTGVNLANPRASHWASDSRTNASVMITAVGVAWDSNPPASCTLHDVHDPQSPMAVTTASHSSAMRSINSTVAAREKVSFLYLVIFANS